MKKPASLALYLLIQQLLPAADTLVGYWKMEATSGPVVADEATGGSANDQAAWVGTAAYPDGVFGQCIVLNGSNHLTVANSTDTNKAGEDMTISIWFRVDAWDENWQALIANGEDARFRVARRGNYADEISFAGGNGGIFGGPVNNDQWYHLAAVTEHNDETRLYIDGARVARNTGAAVLTNNGNDLHIGNNPDTGTGRRWKGAIDDVGLFDEAFDDTKVATLYELATNGAHLLDLGSFNGIAIVHSNGPGGTPVEAGSSVWTYAASDPGGGAEFFAMNGDGSGVIAEPAEITSFTAAPQYVASGESSTLEWEAPGFSNLEIDIGGAWVPVDSLPNLRVSPTVTTTYTLSGDNALGTKTAQVTVYVDALPSVALTATDETITTGGSTMLQWTSAGGTSLEIDHGVGDVLPFTDPSGNGSIVRSGISSTTTYTITATSPAGSAMDSVTITTGDAPVIDSFTIVNPDLVPLEVVDFAWTITGATTADISPAVGSVNPASGTASDYPLTTTTYTLTAANEFGETTADVTAVYPAPLGVDAGLWTVDHVTSTGTINSLSTADALLAGSGVDQSTTVNGVAVINYGPGSSGEFSGDAPPPLGDALNDFVVRATATLMAHFPGEYTFGINNDDGGRLRIDGADVIVDDALHGPRTTNATITLTGGAHTIEYIYFERGGGEAGEVFFVNEDGLNELLGFAAAPPPIPTGDVIINEFMADNNATLDDFEGDSSDWIELYNGSGAAIDLGTYYLTDEIAVPDKYAIPSHILADGGFLVIFASAKDTTFGVDEYHTNFKLAAGGEYLGLHKDDGFGGFTAVAEFNPAFPPQEEDASYGTWGTSQTLGFMPSPSPGGMNSGGVDGFVGDTHFDVDRGIFDTPFSLTITTDIPAATIRYTLDGSEPTVNHGTIFTASIPISRTTVVRAVGFLTGYAPTNIDSHTYIFPADVPLQDQALAVSLGFPSGPVNGQLYEYGMNGGSVSDADVVHALGEIPTISLVMDQEDFSSSATGIYSNAGNRGRGWERPGSVELINENGLGVGQFQMNCGVRIRGGFSRSDNNPKHAFRLFFRGSYEGDLRYPVFQDEGPSRFENLDLRTSQNYSWAYQNDSRNTFLREVHGRDSQREMGQPYTRSRYYQLYINGIYWGLYMTQERSENFYGETYFGGDEDDYDVIKSAGSSGGYRTEATDGDLNGAWHDLWSKARAIRANPTDNPAYFALQGLAPDGVSPHPDPANNPNLMDVDNLIDYLLAIFFTGNYDAPLSTFLGGASNNWYGIRSQVGADGFRFFVHDGEHSLGTGGNSTNRVGPWSTGGNYLTQMGDFTRSNPQYMHEDLAWNAEYRIAFADRVHKHFFNNGVMTDPYALARIDSRFYEIEHAVRAELARWGDGYNYTTWFNAREDIIDFINSGYDGGTSGIGRAATLVDQFRNYNHSGSKPLYPLIDAPVYSLNGGSVPTGFTLQMTNPNPSGLIIYTTDGSDPRLVGGGVNSAASATAGPVTLTSSGPVIARVWDNVGSTWSAANEFEFIVGVAGSAANLVVSEIHYNPTSTLADTFTNKDDYEFIELLNLSDTDTIELTGTRFSAGISFDFTGSNVTQLAPGERVVVVRNQAAFIERYPLVSTSVIAGEYTGNLDNSGERITLLDSIDASIKDFSFNDNIPWPTAADGDGYSLVLNIDQTNPDHTLSLNWRSHGTLHGNPGGPDGDTWDEWVADNGLSGALDADSDYDSITDIIEFANGTDPLSAASKAPLLLGYEGFFQDGLYQEFATITVRRNLEARNLISYAEISPDMVTWSSDPADLVLVEAANQGDGTELVTWRSSLPLSDPGSLRAFLRLRIEAY